MSVLTGALPAAARLLEQARRVVVLTHVQPDADGLGSSAALIRGLRKLGKQAWAAPQEIPASCRFLGLETFQLPEDDKGRFDLAVTLDCPVKARLGSAAALLDRADGVLVVDHHADSQPFGTADYFDANAAATGEMIWSLLGSLSVTMDKDIATALLAAVVADTGSFRYSNTKAATFQLGQKLVEAGALPWEISEHLLESQPISAVKLLAAGLSRIHLELDGKLALLALPFSAFAECGAKEEQSEGLVNHCRGIAGVEVGAFLRGSSDGSVKLSLRSKGRVDVQAVAAQFGGGGHKAAAGATLNCDLAEAELKVLAALKDKF